MKRRQWAWLGGLMVGAGLVAMGCGGSKAPAKDAKQKYAEGDYKTAAKLYAQACDAGNGDSCTRLGTMLLSGKGVDQNDAEAVKRFEQGCDARDPLGCLSAGYAYSRGEAVERDDDRATKAFDKGCKLKHVGSCTEYAVSLWRGRGVAKDPVRAKDMLADNCKKNNAAACFNLGVLIRMGEPGVEKNAKHAMAILDKACKLDAAEACAYLKKHRAALEREATQPTPPEATEAGEAEEPDSEGGDAKE